jgi:hypothetical protein
MAKAPFSRTRRKMISSAMAVSRSEGEAAIVGGAGHNRARRQSIGSGEREHVDAG